MATDPYQQASMDIKAAEAFEATNPAVAVEYYIKARELLGGLLNPASPQNAYYQDMYTKVNNRVVALGGMPGYHHSTPAATGGQTSYANPYNTSTYYQYGATPAGTTTGYQGTTGYGDQSAYSHQTNYQYNSDPGAYGTGYVAQGYTPQYTSTYDPATHFAGSHSSVPAYTPSADVYHSPVYPSTGAAAGGTTAVYAPTTHYGAGVSATPATGAAQSSASSYAALLSGVKVPTASPTVAATATPISAAASAAFVAHNATQGSHSSAVAPSSASNPQSASAPPSSSTPHANYYPSVPAAAPVMYSGASSAPIYPTNSRQEPTPNFTPFASHSSGNLADHGHAHSHAGDEELIRKQHEELRQIEEQKRRQAEELKRQQDELSRIEYERQQKEEQLRKRDEEIRRREEAARQKEEDLRLKDENVRRTEEMLRQREAMEHAKEQERQVLQARLQDELRRAEETRLQYESRRANEQAQLEAERVRLEQQRQWAAAEAAEKERRLQAEMQRREEEAKKFNDEIQKERYMLQARQAQVEATLVQEREKLKAEEERLKKELELKYRGEAELKIRAQEERIQAEMNAARQREAQALREQYERKRAEEEASMRQLKDQTVQQQQEIANRYKEQEMRMQMELEAKYNRLAEQRLLDEEAKIRLEYQEQLNAAEKERQRQEESRRQEEERRAREFEKTKGEESAKMRSMAEELERIRKRNEEVEKERQRVESAGADARKKIEEDARRRIEEETKKRVQAEEEAKKKIEDEKRRTLAFVNQQKQNSQYQITSPLAAPAPLASAPEPPPLQGYMRKMGEGFLSGWKKRWFYTYWKEKRLYYADSETESHPAGFIDLTKVKAVAASQSTKFGIDIITPSRTYYCQTETEAERKYWIDGLRGIVAAATAPGSAATAQAAPVAGTHWGYARRKQYAYRYLAAPLPSAPKSQPAPAAVAQGGQSSVADVVRGLGSNEEKIAKLQAMDKEARDALQRSSTAQAGLEKLVTFYAKDPAAQARAKQQLDEETAKNKRLAARVAEIKDALVALQPSLKNTVVAPKAAPPQPPPRTDLPKSGTGLAKALYDFDAEGPNEVSFRKGDIIVVYEAIPGADWWQGEAKGVVGSFPATYVELTKKPESRMVRADALYDNQAQNPTELSFQAGDILTLLEYKDGEEWWKGEVGGQVGYFPANYVSIRKE